MAAIIDGVEGILGHYGVARQDRAFVSVYVHLDSLPGGTTMHFSETECHALPRLGTDGTKENHIRSESQLLGKANMLVYCREVIKRRVCFESQWIL